MEEHMSVKTIGLVSPGDMGHVVGKVLPKSISAPLTCIASWARRHWQKKHLKIATASARWRRSSKGSPAHLQESTAPRPRP
jgi:hypothetical protein